MYKYVNSALIIEYLLCISSSFKRFSIFIVGNLDILLIEGKFLSLQMNLKLFTNFILETWRLGTAQGIWWRIVLSPWSTWKQQEVHGLLQEKVLNQYLMLKTKNVLFLNLKLSFPKFCLHVKTLLLWQYLSLFYLILSDSLRDLIWIFLDKKSTRYHHLTIAKHKHLKTSTRVSLMYINNFHYSVVLC